MAILTEFLSFCAAVPAFLPRHSRFFTPSFPLFSPVIPAKAGIQMIAAKFAIRNQAQSATSGSLLPLWEKARMKGAPRASAALRAGRARSQRRYMPL